MLSVSLIQKVSLFQLIARTVNDSVVAPIMASFPDVTINNFAHKYRSVPTAGAWWPYQFGDSGTPPAGTGGHVGTAQGGAFYGDSNRSTVLVTAATVGMQAIDNSPFNTMLQHAAIAADMVRTAPHVPVLPWLEPDTTHWSGGAPVLFPLWSEHLFHLALRLRTRKFLWWKAGADRPMDRGMATLSAALHELDAIMTNATSGAWAASCSMETHPSLEAQSLTWAEPLLLSAVRVTCDGAPAADVWRLAFRCEVPTRDADNRQCAYPTAPGRWHVAGGIEQEPVPGGTIVALPGGAPTGHWIVTHSFGRTTVDN